MSDDQQEPEIPLAGGSHSQAVRRGRTVRRVGRPWSSSALELLRHLESQGFDGAPRALGIDDRGREILTYVDGVAGTALPELGAAPAGEDHWIWRDEVLSRLGRLLRRFHEAARTFPGAGREWQVPTRHPAETICHNDVSPGNVIFRAGLPVALIDWESAAPGPRGWDLGYAAWRWVPLWTDEQCREAGLPMKTADRIRRYQLLLDGYGVEPDLHLVHLGIERMRGYLDHQKDLVARGSAWEVETARRGALERMASQITWVEDHAAALAGS